jgi:putative membrane protein
MSGASESTGRLSGAETNASKSGQNVLLGAFLIGVGIMIARALARVPLPFPEGILESVVLSLAFVTTLTSLSGQLPVQNVLLAAVIIGVIGGGIQLAGSLTGIPFGPVVYTHDAGPQLFSSMSWAVPFVWIVAILNARGVARLIMRPWRKLRIYGYWVIGLTAILALLFDSGLEPYATRFNHYWFWRSTKMSINWYGTPFTNFLGWVLTALLVLAFSTPSLMKKKPSKSKLNYHPLVVWIAMNVLFIAASLSQHFWLAAATNTAALILVTAFAVRGANW